MLLTGGLVACGKADTKQQVGAARDNLMNAKVASFTMHFDDPNNELAALSALEPSAGDHLFSRTLKGSSLTVTVDPDGDQSIGTASSTSPSAGKQGAAEAVIHGGALDLTYGYQGKNVYSVRSVAGVLYFRFYPSGYQRLPDASLKDVFPIPKTPGTRAAMKAVKAGKWLKLDMNGSATTPESQKFVDSIRPDTELARVSALVNAMQEHTNYSTTKNGKITVVSLKIDSKAAMTALAGTLEPIYTNFLGALLGSDFADVKAGIAKLPAGTVNGSITSADDHFTSMDVDLGSVAALSKDPLAKKIKTAKLVVDVNDHADPITGPSAIAISPIDPGELTAALFFEVLAAPSNFGETVPELPQHSGR